MGDQGAFDFGGAQPAPIYFEKVVRAASVPKITVAILAVLVACAEPMADESVLGFFVLIPVRGAGGIAAYEEIADLIDCDIAFAFVDNARFVARD